MRVGSNWKKSFLFFSCCYCHSCGFCSKITPPDETGEAMENTLRISTSSGFKLVVCSLVYLFLGWNERIFHWEKWRFIRMRKLYVLYIENLFQYTEFCVRLSLNIGFDVFRWNIHVCKTCGAGMRRRCFDSVFVLLLFALPWICTSLLLQNPYVVCSWIQIFILLFCC